VEAGSWYTPTNDESFDRRVIRGVVTVVIIVLALYLIYLLRTPLMWMVMAMFLAIAVSGPVNVLERHLPRTLSIGIVYSAIVLVPVVLGALLLPPLVNSTVDLVHDLPEYIDNFQQTLEKDARFQKIDENFDVQQQLTELQKNLASRVGDAAGALSQIGEWVLSSVFGGFTIFILSIFMVARGRHWMDALVGRRPGPEGQAMERTFGRIGVSVSRYIGGAMLQAFVAGLAAFIVLKILGVSSPLVLAVIVGVFDVIPMVGSTIAGLIVGTVTLFAGSALDTAIWAVFVVAYQQFENYVIQPRIQSEAVKLEPFVVMTAVIFGGTLMGVVGAILAIPVAATIMIGWQEWGSYKAEVRAMTAGGQASSSTIGDEASIDTGDSGAASSG
jgi:predicted PurR-regulated permease PerM